MAGCSAGMSAPALGCCGPNRWCRLAQMDSALYGFWLNANAEARAISGEPQPGSFTHERYERVVVTGSIGTGSGVSAVPCNGTYRREVLINRTTGELRDVLVTDDGFSHCFETL